MTQIRKKTAEEHYSSLKTYAFMEYDELLNFRTRVDDCLQGQRNIKRKAIYLPPNQWQKEHPDEYFTYVERALFYSMTSYAMRLYEGLTMSGEPEVLLPKDGRMDFLRKYATVHRRDLHALQANLNREQLAHGLRCLLAEPTQDNDRPFFIQEYCANAFLRAVFYADDQGVSRPRMILLDESGYQFDMKRKEDEFVERFLVLGIDANGLYYQCRIKPEQWQAFDVDHPSEGGMKPVYPVFRGMPMRDIPFTWCGATSLSGSALDIPPLIDMADCEIKLFQLDAQFSQHIYQSCQETVFYKNCSKNFRLANIRYGCGAHNALPKDVEPMVLSTNGIGFDAQRQYMDSIVAQIELRRMSIMSSKSHQSGLSVGIVQNAQTAPLRMIVDQSGAAITEQLRYIAKWMGYEDKDVDIVSYTPSKEFANIDTDLSQFVALCQSVIEGTVPMLEEDLYRMAKDNGFVNSKRTWEEFKKQWRLEKLRRGEDLGMTIPRSGNADFYGSGRKFDTQNPPSQEPTQQQNRKK